MLFVTDWVDLQLVLCWWNASWESESKGLNRLLDTVCVFIVCKSAATHNRCLMSLAVCTQGIQQADLLLRPSLILFLWEQKQTEVQSKKEAAVSYERKRRRRQGRRKWQGKEEGSNVDIRRRKDGGEESYKTLPTFASTGSDSQTCFSTNWAEQWAGLPHLFISILRQVKPAGQTKVSVSLTRSWKLTSLFNFLSTFRRKLRVPESTAVENIQSERVTQFPLGCCHLVGHQRWGWDVC